MAERLFLRLRPSPVLAALLASVHALAAATLWFAPLSLAFALPGSLALLAHFAWTARRHAFHRGGGAVVELEFGSDGAVSAASPAGLIRVYRIAGSTFVSAQLVVLNLRPEAGRRARSVLIAPDSVDADSFRRLRVWLTWRWAEGQSGISARAPAPPHDDNRTKEVN